MALSNGISYQTRSTGAGVLTNQLMTNRERREYTAPVISKIGRISPVKKLSQDQLDLVSKKLQEIIEEHFIPVCHEYLTVGEYEFGTGGGGTFKCCNRTFQIHTVVEILIQPLSEEHKNNVH